MNSISDVITFSLEYIHSLINNYENIYVNINLPIGSGVSKIVDYFERYLNKNQLDHILINGVRINELPNKFNLFDYRNKSDISDKCIVLNISLKFGMQIKEKYNND